MWLGGGGTDHCRAPPEVGRAPGGPARIADIVPQSEGFEPELGGLDVPDGISSRARVRSRMASSADLGDIDRCEVP